MTMLYLDCAAGISGDMTVAALLDLGASAEKLKAALASLPVEGFQTRISRVQKSGLDCCDFDVVLEHDNHDHDMAYLHGHEHSHETEPHAHGHVDGGHGVHAHEHNHVHDHEHGDEHSHDHVHRGLADIEAIIDAGDLTPNANRIAKRIFRIVAQAEAKAHGVPVDQVHFHEVGAVDSIVDVVAVAVCVDDLGITECAIPVLNEGTGTVRAQHGILPIPVPAVANIIQQQGLAVSIMEGVHGEFITPTGAAIAAALKTQDALPATFKVLKCGMGAGKRTYERPSILRAMIIEPADAMSTDLDHPHLWKLETEVDDCSAEALGYLLDRLYDAGAREAHFIPVFMKKNRPGYQIEVLCGEADIPQLERIMFEDTTTIGVRRSPLWRTALPRELDTVETAFGPMGVKRVVLPSGKVRAYPEHDTIARIARDQNIPYQDVLREAFRNI